MARLKDKYKNEIAGALAKEFEIKNPSAVPKITKVIVNMDLGSHAHAGELPRSDDRETRTSGRPEE